MRLSGPPAATLPRAFPDKDQRETPGRPERRLWEAVQRPRRGAHHAAPTTRHSSRFRSQQLTIRMFPHLNFTTTLSGSQQQTLFQTTSLS